MAAWSDYNPFGKRDSHGSRAVTAYKIFTALSWVLSIVVSWYYTFHTPDDVSGERSWTIWGQNARYATAFSLNPVITDIYWVLLWVMQAGYVGHLFSKNTDIQHAAASVGSHFILNNLFHFAFVMLFARSEFVWAEIVLILNFFNLSSLYVRHNTYPRFIHAPVVSGPLAWDFVALFWNGAVMVPHPSATVARIFGNVFIWVIFLYGMFFLIFYKDYTMGFWLSVLCASLGVHQFLAKVIALQWIFAFVIMAVLFVTSLAIALPTWAGRDLRLRRVDGGDAERAPLLNEGNIAPAAATN